MLKQTTSTFIKQIISKFKQFKIIFDCSFENKFEHIIAFICISLFAFNFWLFYPGYTTHDWSDVLGKMSLSDWHPLLYAIVLRYLSAFFGKHLYFPLLFNLIPFYLGIYVIILALWKRFHSKWCLLGLLPICVGNIFYNNLILHCSYSSPMIVFLLWAIVLYQILVGITFKNLFFTCIVFILALLSRHNAIVQVYPIFFVYTFCIVKNLKITHKLLRYFELLFIFAIFTVIMAFGIPQLLREGQTYPGSHIFLNHIAGVCIPNNDASCFEPEWYENGKTFADVVREYEPLNADKMSAPWELNRPFKLTKLDNLHKKWIQSIVKYPADYFRYLKKYIKTMWFYNTVVHKDLSISTRCFQTGDCNWLILENGYNVGEVYYKTPSEKITIYNSLKKVLPTPDTQYFIILNVILFITFCVLFFKKKDYLSLYVLSSSFCGIISFIIFCTLAPLTYFRYVYPAIIPVIIALTGAVIYVCNRRINKNIETININLKINRSEKLLILITFLILGYLSSYTTARVDIYSSFDNEHEILIYTEKGTAPVLNEGWMFVTENSKKVIQKFGKDMDFYIIPLQDNHITIKLRGQDIKDNNGIQLEKTVTYTDLSINGQHLLSNNKTVSYDKSYRYDLPVKKYLRYHVKIKWKK